MPRYESFDDIELALKQLKLKQQIEIEELKYTGYSLKEKFSFQDPLYLKTILTKAFKNFGLLMFLKKLFKKH